jgi:hypothetical protein
MLVRLAYLAVSNAFAALRLLPMSDREKDIEILILRHQISALQRQRGACRCRLFRPCWSGRMFILVEGSAEAVVSSDVEVADPGLFGDRFGRGARRRTLVERPMRPMGVVVGLELAQRVQQVGLVPDQFLRPLRWPPWWRENRAGSVRNAGLPVMPYRAR